MLGRAGNNRANVRSNRPRGESKSDVSSCRGVVAAELPCPSCCVVLFRFEWGVRGVRVCCGHVEHYTRSATGYKSRSVSVIVVHLGLDPDMQLSVITFTTATRELS